MDAYLGEIRFFAGTFAPVGWALCDGSVIPIAENDALYQLIGTTFGGDGQVTMGLPDLRGRVPVGAGTSPGDGIPYTVGEMAGQETVTLTASNIPAHTHPIVTSSVAGVNDTAAAGVLAVAPTECTPYVDGAATTALAAGHIQLTGGSVPHNNMQPYMTVNYIIATSGIYPSQP